MEIIVFTGKHAVAPFQAANDDVVDAGLVTMVTYTNVYAGNVKAEKN